ncbi:MAG: 23S rRNA (guanosine(2251)-2'-O)-methyltransferase RlmB [Stackebrandtia sp.]
MAGNSQRKGRRTTPKKGPTKGSGGQGKRSLAGRGKTLSAEDRPWHKAYEGTDVPKKTKWKQEKERRQAASEGRTPKTGGGGRPAKQRRDSGDGVEVLVGRNPVVEALRAHVPTTALYVVRDVALDERVREALRVAGNRDIPILEVSKAEMDRLCKGAMHQGVGLQVPPFHYEPFSDVLAAAAEHARPPLLVGLDGVLDPRNLGAIVRSAGAFGAHGVVVPQRRAAGMTATAWRASAGAAARLPVSKVVNLTRAIREAQEAGLLVVGLDADGEVDVFDLPAAVDPLMIVVGSEGRGLSRLVGESCDLRVGIPMAGEVESLNASVAASVALAEVARRRGVGA